MSKNANKIITKTNKKIIIKVEKLKDILTPTEYDLFSKIIKKVEKHDRGGANNES